MKFNTMFTEREPIVINSGNRYKIEYQLRIIDGEEKLEEVGKTDLYEYIQSHKDSVDIHKILERCALIEDYSLLNKMPTTFMDAVGMPTSLMQYHQMIKDAENYFDQMPKSIKEHYENSALKFIQDIGSENFKSVVGSFLESIKEKKVESINEKKDEVIDNA